ncbi:hypothetical protein COZ61_00095 [Candidatus Berkelbacteria bacterium CG_4_8_14_3_um_filter_33_6]|uniref:Uncharacterized protein n=1 Tax=Candidatus Berkelbacteria bacterium CG_4_10_14_0_2_um_filter_35_9_33_12 TaxID=1974499 RepID=A0A2M7W4G6_9BACT|nr:MAG: hypothetical protein COX10_01635 [Candidatus Berkelbacteria bacterium CG23_combo_of_CG06-09_8_20_14_all_33_15]PIX31367.1 MAG: hypothetical protein COZ61_00095 [Candidatus Berkelbacteria bacterium CG_4_8_14_3_um_filter_33_6]PJA20683.1 MAG: hypothetical protein COX60_00975 [Candidatus Berkelbacteria bacterium CG_4_10_14_0_2_um_filter_35_9_33_12]PJB52001.1 MAG: hypothetical protein CO100_01210 [Candidatus Berkelbacteria bacterium CG_4_9_14_3_um_filter_33_5]
MKLGGLKRLIVWFLVLNLSLVYLSFGSGVERAKGASSIVCPNWKSNKSVHVGSSSAPKGPLSFTQFKTLGVIKSLQISWVGGNNAPPGYFSSFKDPIGGIGKSHEMYAIERKGKVIECQLMDQGDHYYKDRGDGMTELLNLNEKIDYKIYQIYSSINNLDIDLADSSTKFIASKPLEGYYDPMQGRSGDIMEDSDIERGSESFLEPVNYKRQSEISDGLVLDGTSQNDDLYILTFSWNYFPDNTSSQSNYAIYGLLYEYNVFYSESGGEWKKVNDWGDIGFGANPCSKKFNTNPDKNLRNKKYSCGRLVKLENGKTYSFQVGSTIGLTSSTYRYIYSNTQKLIVDSSGKVTQDGLDEPDIITINELAKTDKDSEECLGSEGPFNFFKKGLCAVMQMMIDISIGMTAWASGFFASSININI